MKFILTSIAVLLFAGCASYGSEFDITKFNTFKNGVTTKSEIINVVGSPNTQNNMGNGQTSVTWQFTSKTLGSDVRSKIATAIFDSQDRLIRVITSESKH